MRASWIVVAVSMCACSEDAPSAPIVPPDEATMQARVAFATINDDYAYWIARARNDSVLTWYTGTDDHEGVARYLIESQWLTPDGGVGTAPAIDDTRFDFTSQDTLYGCYTGDVPDWPTYDEGVMGAAMALLSMMIREHGDLWRFRHPDTGQERTMTMALDDAVRCTLRGQFAREPGHPDWIVGLWPQAPGWADGRAFFSNLDGRNVAALLTFNDLSAEMNVEGLAIVCALLDRPYEALVLEHILQAATATRLLQSRYRGALPEQAERNGMAAWGRAHEPPCVSSRATSSAVKIFNVAHAFTNDPRWRVGAEQAVDWLERAELDDGTWEMYLDVASNHPDEIVPAYSDGHYHLIHDRTLANYPPPYFPYPAGYIYRWGIYLRDFVDVAPAR